MKTTRLNLFQSKPLCHKHSKRLSSYSTSAETDTKRDFRSGHTRQRSVFELPLRINQYQSGSIDELRPHCPQDNTFRIKKRVFKHKKNAISVRTQPVEKDNQDRDFERFYSIGKKYWNIEDHVQKDYTELPYIKRAGNKYDFNNRYFGCLNSQTDVINKRQSFEAMRKVFVNLDSKYPDENFGAYDNYSEEAKRSLKRSIKNQLSIDDTEYAKKVVEHIYDEEYKSIQQQLTRIHRIKARHCLIQKIKEQRRLLLEQYQETSSHTKLFPYI